MGALVLSLDLLGVAVSLEVSDEALARQFSALLSGFGCAASPGHRLRVVPDGDAFRLYDGERLLREQMTAPGTVNVVLWTLNQLALTTTDYAVLHAGCVARYHRGVILSAPSGAGKSTLVAALVEAGSDYLSDEFAAVADDGRIQPYPSPLGLKAGSFGLFPHLRPPPWEIGDPQRWSLPPERLGRGARSEPAAAHALVLNSFSPGARCRLEPVDTLTALREVVSGCANLDGLGKGAFESLVAFVGSVPAYRLSYGDLPDAVAVLEGIVAEAPPRPRPGHITGRWPPARAGAAPIPVVSGRDISSGGASDGRRERRAMTSSGPVNTELLRAAPGVIGARIGDEVVIYHPEARRIDCLDPYASMVWDLCDGTRDAEAIAAEITTASQGDPALIAARVEAAVATFAELGLLQ